ncbi:hypothetical protein E1301_Tti019607 [Triplophysa tibetana]|uniref:C-type lectin domain-containing protein n=1 Tax=Triplophysa tibetana TaxID=1572043 RepID=A0A5A9PJ70_9TELE|nr:hypothetical protein E1301_Tti019607 [Triplophysa tibetana]
MVKRWVAEHIVKRKPVIRQDKSHLQEVVDALMATKTPKAYMMSQRMQRRFDSAQKPQPLSSCKRCGKSPSTPGRSVQRGSLHAGDAEKEDILLRKYGLTKELLTFKIDTGAAVKTILATMYSAEKPNSTRLDVMGFWPFCHGVSNGYALIQQQSTWAEAQAYCRQNHIDLATVQSDDPDLQEVINPALISLAWTGLYRVGNNWWWIYLKEKMKFTFWKPGEPDNLNGNDACGVISNSGWIDVQCHEMYPFFCYNVNGTAQYVFISDIQLSWHDAISYCQVNYTNLVSIWDQIENDQLVLMMQGFERAWIGLFWATWSWSDESTASFNWMIGQPNKTGLNHSCGAVGPDALMDDRFCSDALPFICLTCTKQKILRMEVKSGQNLNDPAVLETILQSVGDKVRVRNHVPKGHRKFTDPLTVHKQLGVGTYVLSDEKTWNASKLTAFLCKTTAPVENTAIIHELRGSGQLLGYRAMCQTLREKYLLTVTRGDLLHTLRRLNPSGVHLRQRHRTQFWIELFSDMRERHHFNGSHEHKCLLRYVFLGILQKEFDDYRKL